MTKSLLKNNYFKKIIEPQKYFNSNLRILDYGCGSGENSSFFLTQGYYIVSVDINSEAKKNIIINLKNGELNKFDFINLNGETEYIDYNCNSDIIFCLEILEYIKNYLNIIGEFKRILSDKEVLIISQDSLRTCPGYMIQIGYLIVAIIIFFKKMI